MKTVVFVTDATERTLQSGVHYVRPLVAAFALQMEAKLAANEHRGGWQGLSPELLLSRLLNEADELTEAVRSGSANPSYIHSVAADIGNYALMIADNATQPRPTSAAAP